MYAVEFETQLENGAIQVPDIYQTTLTGLIKMIILKDIPVSAALWPSKIMAFQGAFDMPPFESYREELLPPPADPFT